jgi:hypothetical protein
LSKANRIENRRFQTTFGRGQGNVLNLGLIAVRTIVESQGDNQLFALKSRAITTVNSLFFFPS